MAQAGGTLWIFGYGSLVWRPAFPHRRSRPAFIEGFARRFWQGSTDHRGLPGAPGRVVTLLPDHYPSVHEEAGFRPERCWGTAYEVPANDPEGVLAGLDHRERGGYQRIELELTLPSAAASHREATHEPPTDAPERVQGLVYVAGPDNENYLGPASLEAIARQVAGACGPSGENPEYVFELDRSLRAMGAHDSHVFGLADRLRALLGASSTGGPRHTSGAANESDPEARG